MNRKCLNICFWVSIAVIFALGVYNYFCNQKFFVVSLATCMSLLIAAVFSFYFVQRQTDYRRRKEIFIQLLESLRLMVDDEKSYLLVNISKEQILMRKRDISNKIEFISKFGDEFSAGDNVAFLQKMFSEYETIIGDHIDDMQTLSKLNNELHRPLMLMSQKIFEIMLNLYG